MRGHCDSAVSLWCSREHMGPWQHRPLAPRTLFLQEGYEKQAELEDINSVFLVQQKISSCFISFKLSKNVYPKEDLKQRSK